MARRANHDSFHHSIQFNEGDPIVSVVELQPDGKNQWIHGELSIESKEQKLTYTACPQCKRSTAALPNETFDCYNCKGKQEAHLKLDVHLTNDSGTVKATFFDRIAEELIGYAPAELMAMPKEAVADLLERTGTSFKGRKIHAYIRTMKAKYCDGKPRYAIQQIQPRTAAKDGTGSSTSSSGKLAIPTAGINASTTSAEDFVTPESSTSVIDGYTEAKTKADEGISTNAESSTSSSGKVAIPNAGINTSTTSAEDIVTPESSTSVIDGSTVGKAKADEGISTKDIGGSPTKRARS